MGVFARLFGKSKTTTEEAQSAEAEATQVRDGAEAGAAANEAKSTAEAKGQTDPVDAEAGSETAVKETAVKETVVNETAVKKTAAEETTAEQSSAAADNESLGIPKQQSAEEAADSEASEGART